MPRLSDNLRLSVYLAAAIFLPATHSLADEIMVAVASNFTAPAKTLVEQFEQATAHEVTLIFGSTGKHYAQVMNGAPYDVLLAADARRPKLLDAGGRSVPESRIVYAIGRLALWSAQPGYVDADGAVLARDDFRFLAIANPDLAPYGAAAVNVMQALGVWDRLQGRLVRGENIGQTFQFVRSRNAELGFVAVAQLRGLAPTVAGSLWEVPPTLYPPIEQQAVLLTDSGAAREFLDYLQSDPAKTIIAEFGYAIP